MTKESVAYSLLRSGLFTALAGPAFDRLVREVTRVEIAAGETIVREGDRADAAYVVVSGALDVVTTAADGQEVHLGKLAAGAHFGEQALLDGGEGRRRATVRGRSARSELVRIGREQLDAVFHDDPELKKKLVALGRRQLEEQLSRRTELVRVLLGGAETTAVERTLDNGDVLYRQGDAPRAFYVVLAGQVELLVDRGGLPLRVALVGAGLCVGERDEGTHAATAVIDGPTRVLEVDRAALTRLTAASAETKNHLATLQSLWELPQRGFVTQHLGSVDGRPCVTQLFHLADRRRFVSSHVIGDGGVRFEAAQGEAARTLATPDGEVRVQLELDGRIWSIEAARSVPVLAALFARAIEGRPLAPSEEQNLADAGTLSAEPEGFLCACLRVLPGAVRDAIAAGANTLPLVQQRTGCGLSCGSCIPRIKEMLGESAFAPVVVARLTSLTDEVRRVELAAEDGAPLPPARPGQHVVLRCEVNGAPIERAYTLSGAAGGAWEVTVKREPGGAFSSWLFEHARAGATLSASAPQGNYVWDGGPPPVVCLVCGIGVTPALAIVRTLLREGWPHRVVVDWSTRHDHDLAILGELRAPPSAANIVWNTRVTSRTARLSAADVAPWPKRLPTAVYFLCGTEAFMTDVRCWLREAGVPDARIRIEHFLQGSPLHGGRT